MSKFFETKMNEIEQSIAHLTAMTAGEDRDVEFDSYYQTRFNMNINIAEIVFGATINLEKNKIRFNHTLPSTEELARLFQLFNEFYTNVEEPIMDKFLASANHSINSMYVEPYIPEFSKIKVKTVKSAVLGSEENPFSIVELMFTPSNLIEMASLAERTRKIVRRNQAIIIGGIVLAVAAAATVGICVYNKKKDHDDIDGIETTDEVTDEDVYSDVDADDVPVVDLEAV